MIAEETSDFAFTPPKRSITSVAIEPEFTPILIGTFTDFRALTSFFKSSLLFILPGFILMQSAPFSSAHIARL